MKKPEVVVLSSLEEPDLQWRQWLCTPTNLRSQDSEDDLQAVELIASVRQKEACKKKINSLFDLSLNDQNCRQFLTNVKQCHYTVKGNYSDFQAILNTSCNVTG